MKSLLRITPVLFFVLFFAVLPGGRAVAQQASAPTLQPAASGPTLAATMQFIQEKLSELGQVNYAAYNHDNADGKNWTSQFSTVDTNVVADPAACRISYHEKRTREGAVTADADYNFSLAEIQSVITEPREQLLKKVNTANGHPTWDARIDPPVTMLVAQKAEDTEWYFYFIDGAMAERVANAMNHAVELCGGGKKEPF
jgi:hypothetical protein